METKYPNYLQEFMTPDHKVTILFYTKCMMPQ